MAPLIGRSAELERIELALARRDSLPAGILIHGRAGIGKTALWSSAVGRARGAGYRVLECTLTRHEARLAFAGLADLIGLTLDEILPALAPPQAQALEIALALSQGDRPADERAVAFALHAAVLRLASREPLAIAIDDIQWLDPSSALMLSYAVRRLRSEPVLLLLARRDGEPGEHEVSLTDGTAVVFERIALGPLPMGALHRLIRTRLGFSLTRPQLLHVQAASAGNPLHALELARAIGPGAADVGNELASLLAVRISALPESTQDALAVAAVAAEGDVEILRGAYGPTFLEDLEPAVRDDLVAVVGDAVRFTHPLIALAAEAAVSERRRAEHHRSLARVAGSTEARALHLAEAADEPDDEVAEALEAAAAAARRRGARAARAARYKAAARMSRPDDGSHRVRRLLAAAEAWHEAGDGRRAESILTAILADVPPGEVRCEASWRLGILRDDAGRWREAVALWREALAGVPGPGIRSRILGSLAITTFYTGSTAEARDLATAAVDAAEASGEPAQLARALAAKALTLAMSGRGGVADLLERALALEVSIDDPLGDWSPSAVAAETARHAGDVAGAQRHYQSVLERAIDRDDANQEQWAAYGLALTLLLSGNYGRASELADSVLDLADQTGQMRIPAKALRAHVDAYLGDLAGARTLAREAVDEAIAADEPTHRFTATLVAAMIETSAGRQEAALTAFADARQIATAVGLRHATALRAYLEEAETAALAGHLDQAETALAAFESAVDGVAPHWAAPLRHRAIAAILAAKGSLDEARDEAAKGLTAEDLLPFDRGRALLEMGVFERRQHAHARAREDLTRAVEVFTALGAQSWSERARVELARIPGRRTGHPEGLTESEARIAALVAEGRSNKEVAAALFLAVKTVEVTLTRVYSKLGVRSRAELAHHFAETPKQ